MFFRGSKKQYFEFLGFDFEVDSSSNLIIIDNREFNLACFLLKIDLTNKLKQFIGENEEKAIYFLKFISRNLISGKLKCEFVVFNEIRLGVFLISSEISYFLDVTNNFNFVCFDNNTFYVHSILFNEKIEMENYDKNNDYIKCMEYFATF
jgi:hypothetical protein